MINKNEKLSLPAALIIGLNAAIGAGVFTAPLPVHALAGPAGIFSYVIVTLLILCIGIALTQLLKKHPTSAFFYDLPCIWGGHKAGMFATYLYSAGLIMGLGLLGKIAGVFLAPLLPCLSPTMWTTLLLIGTALGSQISTAWLTWGQYVLFFLTIAPMILISGIGFTFGTVANLLPFTPQGIGGVFSATPIVAFGFFGFEAIPALFSRIQNPEKNITRAISGTILITGLVYILFITSIFFILPSAAFGTASLGQALVSVVPQYNWLIQMITWAIIITITGTLYSMFPAISSILIQAHKKQMSATKRTSILIAVPIIAIIVANNAYDIDFLFNLTAIGIIGAFACSIAPLLTSRKTDQIKNTALGTLAMSACVILLACALIGIV
jgi:amino acid transporter